MSSGNVFDAMTTGKWERAKEVIATTSWTSADLEKRHGVQSDLLDDHCKVRDGNIENIL